MFKNNRLDLKNADIFSPLSRGPASSKNGRIPQLCRTEIFSGDVVDPRTGYPSFSRCFARGNPNHPHPRILTARAGIQDSLSGTKNYSAAVVSVVAVEAAAEAEALFNCDQVLAPTIPSTLRLLSF